MILYVIKYTDKIQLFTKHKISNENDTRTKLILGYKMNWLQSDKIKSC